MRLLKVPLRGGLPVLVLAGHAGLATFAPDGHAIAYTPTLSEFQSRKRYFGGLAPDVFTYDFKTKQRERITNWNGTDTSPMWVGNRIYFVSDRDCERRMNLWVLDLKTSRTRQVTHFKDFDIDMPSLGLGSISFQQAGHMFRLSVPDEKLEEIAVNVPADPSLGEEREISVQAFVRGTNADGPRYALSPDGKNAIFSARGDLYRVQASPAQSQQLTHTSNADESQPAYSPDGANLAYVSDISGSEQIWIHPLSSGNDLMVTSFKAGHLYRPVWSPDAKSVAIADSNSNLWLFAAAGGASRRVAHDDQATIKDAAFSPDGRWLSFSTQRSTGFRALHVYKLSTGKDTIPSSSANSDFSPSFSEDSKYLLFLSTRRPVVVSADNELGYAATKTTGIFLATLSKETPSPFATPSNVTSSPPQRDNESDLSGLMDRAIAIPKVSGGISTFVIRGSQLIYQTEPPDTYVEDFPGERTSLHSFDMSTQEDHSITEGLSSFCVSADGQRILYQRDRTWHLLETDTAHPNDVQLNLTSLKSRIVLRQEWTEMFNQAWRLERDLFLDPEMQGNNWEGIRDRYAKLLPSLGSREDLNYLIAQVEGELASSHTFVFGGDEERAVTPETALLGVDFALDQTSGRYRFSKIYKGYNTRPGFRSPLNEPGLNIAEGTYLLAVNGKEVESPEDPYAPFVGIKDTVALTIAPSAAGPRHIIRVVPVRNEANLRKLAWMDAARAVVEKKSGGKLGYIYLSDFYDSGMQEFMEQYCAQTDKQGLIIDVRWNASGNSSQWILEHLRRMEQGGYRSRGGGNHDLQTLIPGPKLVLMNAFTASDGDQFAYLFRKEGLGKLLGERTWGGVRGLNDAIDLLDGGQLLIPHNALHDADNRWIIENYGVNPDMAIDEGEDEGKLVQRGVSMLLQQLKAHPTSSLPLSNRAYPVDEIPLTRQ